MAKSAETKAPNHIQITRTWWEKSVTITPKLTVGALKNAGFALGKEIAAQESLYCISTSCKL